MKPKAEGWYPEGWYPLTPGSSRYFGARGEPVLWQGDAVEGYSWRPGRILDAFSRRIRSRKAFEIRSRANGYLATGE